MQDELHELLETLDFESYLEHEGIDYRRKMGSSGPQLNIRSCPSCGHSDWKVYANTETGLGNCFHGSCDLTTFNKWKFIKAHLGDIASRDVIAHIKTVAGVMGWKPKRKARYTDSEKPALILPASIKLPDANGANLPYLEMRGVTAELCEYFQLSYCDAGAFRYEENGQRRFQDYSKRVIIPVFDMEGKLASFQGRDITKTAERKYLFPPGFASTGSLLYNGHNAWGIKRLVIGEGAFDVIAIKAAFDQEFELRDIVPIGTFGKHIALDQMAKICELKRKGLEEVTIMWDGEKAALHDALKASKTLTAIGVKSRVALLPQDRDPNEVTPAKLREVFMTAANPATSDGLRRILARLM